MAADLYDSILDIHLDDHEQHWKPLLASQAVQHDHWDWRKKMEHYSSQLSYQSFAIECSGMTQGLMIVNTMKRCHISTQANKHLVYIEDLESAPWNVCTNPTLKGIATVLMAAAIQLSRDEGKLVPQDLTDEPAGVLLEWLRAKQAIHEENGKRPSPARTRRSKSRGNKL